MSANTKISNVQLQILMILYIIGSSIVLPLAAGAGRDSWISIMGAVVIGEALAWIYVYLCQSYPRKSIIEIGELLLGGVGWKNHRDIICLVQFTPWYARFKKLFGV